LRFFPKRIRPAQRKYSTTDQELLLIAENLKEFRHMLLGRRVVVHTYHQNLTRDMTTLGLDRVFRQRLLIEEYGVEIMFIEGKSNIVADFYRGRT
jgi:hypothetical protein